MSMPKVPVMPPHDNIKFLLVDDIEENLLALEALLQRDGLELIRARSGREALELLLVHDFALALLDVQMPEMDGFELAEMMRGTERTRRIPIIFLTAVATDERRRFRGYESGAVDYLLKPLDPQMLKNKVGVFFELACQRQELAHQRDELQDAARKLANALARLQAHHDNSPLGVVEFDPDFRVISWSKGAERMFGWSADEVVGKSVFDLDWLHEEGIDHFAASAEEMKRGKRLRNIQHQRNNCKNGNVIDTEWYVSALRDSLGNLASVNVQILDVTERKRAEATQELLIGELNHRVKNTLATVQAIATQTLRHSHDPTDFAANFSGRLQSLARAHSLLSSTNWSGTRLVQLIQDQRHVSAIEESRLSIFGPDVYLPPQLALHLALILHELTTNAQKHGALSSAKGRIDLNWVFDGETLQLEWNEAVGRPIEPPRSKRGFGTSLIERSTAAEGGTARCTYGPETMTWVMTFSLSKQSAYSTPSYRLDTAHQKQTVKA